MIISIQDLKLLFHYYTVGDGVPFYSIVALMNTSVAIKWEYSDINVKVFTKF